MRFDNAFICKSGVVGMQFSYGKSNMVSVFHDGNKLQVSEDAPIPVQEIALKRYNDLLPRFTQ